MWAIYLSDPLTKPRLELIFVGCADPDNFNRQGRVGNDEILLYGCSAMGKTLLAKAVRTLPGSPSITSRWVTSISCMKPSQYER